MLKEVNNTSLRNLRLHPYSLRNLLLLDRVTLSLQQVLRNALTLLTQAISICTHRLLQS